MAHVQGEGSPLASVAFLSDTPPEIIARSLAPVFDRNEVFIAHLGCSSDWPEVELELDLVWPRTLVTIGEVTTRLVLGEVELAQIHGEPFRIGDFIVVPIYAPSPPPWHVRWACDLQTLHRFLNPKPDPIAPEPSPPVVLRPKKKATPHPRLWTEGDLP